MTLASLVLLAALVPSAAQAQSTPSAPSAAKPTLPSSLGEYFAGRWNGSGSFARDGKPVESSFEFEPRFGGEAMLVRHAEKAPNGFAYDAVLTVDSVRGDLVMLMASNNKGGGRLFRSAGWQGDTLVFQSAPELRAAFALERITFSRQTAGSFQATYEMSRDGTAWRVGDVQVFVRG